MRGTAQHSGLLRERRRLLGSATWNIKRGACTEAIHRRASLNEQVLDKTGGLFRLSVKLMQAFSENKRHPPACSVRPLGHPSHLIRHQRRPQSSSAETDFWRPPRRPLDFVPASAIVRTRGFGIDRDFARAGSDFVPLVNDLSLLYQVLDDYQNLKSSSCAPLRSRRQCSAQGRAHICTVTTAAGTTRTNPSARARSVPHSAPADSRSH